MYELFSNRARDILKLAHQEAQRRGVDHIGSEHILLGIVRRSVTRRFLVANWGLHPEKQGGGRSIAFAI